MIDRLITTDMSASIVAKLIKGGWTPTRIARRIGAPLSFVRGVQAKANVLTMQDIAKLARGTGETPELLAFNAIPRSSIKPELRELFEATRDVLETSAAVRTSGSRKRTTSKRRSRVKAA